MLAHLIMLDKLASQKINTYRGEAELAAMLEASAAPNRDRLSLREHKKWPKRFSLIGRRTA